MTYRRNAMAAVKSWNDRIIEEFRTNQGRVGGQFANVPILLLHHTGARTGKVRVNPLAYQTDGDRFVVFASKGGAPTNPDWFHNLKANPETTVEVGTETIPVKARVTEGEERERLWSRVKKVIPGFAAYENRTPRTIPVIVLERAG
jgi:deazaflavin-dependent oxidoreductase (nitroreductase family)